MDTWNIMAIYGNAVPSEFVCRVTTTAYIHGSAHPAHFIHVQEIQQLLHILRVRFHNKYIYSCYWTTGPYAGGVISGPIECVQMNGHNLLFFGFSPLPPGGTKPWFHFTNTTATDWCVQVPCKRFTRVPWLPHNYAQTDWHGQIYQATGRGDEHSGRFPEQISTVL